MLAHGGGNLPRSEEEFWSDSSSLSWKAGEARDVRVVSLLRSLRGSVGHSDDIPIGPFTNYASVEGGGGWPNSDQRGHLHMTSAKFWGF